MIPVLIRYGEDASRLDGWGRLVELSSSGARLSTRSEILRRERIFLSFEVSGEKFTGFSARADHVDIDTDGYFLADLTLEDEVLKRRLARVLIDLISR